MIGKLTGGFSEWTLCDRKRQYGTVQNLPFCEAREYIVPVCFNGQTGFGQQRDIVESHVRRLKKEMEAGTYTPTNISAACSKKHRSALMLNNDGTFVLSVSSADPLLHTDGGHRFAALQSMVKELEEKVEKAEGEEKEQLSRWLEQARNVPVTVTVYFDGNPAEDFVRLQQGRPVDAAHLLSLKVQHKVLDNPAVRVAFEVAKVLHKQKDSPLHSLVRFDSRGKLPLPVSTICSTGSSDIGTSLVGLARVGQMGDNPKEAAWLANAVIAATQALQKEAQALLDHGKVLAMMANGGKKGSTTMLVGLGVVLAYRMVVLGHSQPTEEDLTRLVQTANNKLNESVNGNFSGPTKRKLLGLFAQDFLADLTGPKHCGLPVTLLRTLSPSTFGVEPLPKEKKRRPKATKGTGEQVVGSPNEVKTESAVAPQAVAVA
jgi:hypothetical protein